MQGNSESKSIPLTISQRERRPGARRHAQYLRVLGNRHQKDVVHCASKSLGM